MAAILRPWIATTIINHDQQHGADLAPHLTAPVLCQVVKVRAPRPS
jgi:hypothetical protein